MSSFANAVNASGGSTRRSGETRPIACGQYVPQWIGTTARGRIRRTASTALSGPRCRPRPRVGPQPQTGMRARSTVPGDIAHRREEVGISGEVDGLTPKSTKPSVPAAGPSGGRIGVDGGNHHDPDAAESERLAGQQLAHVREAGRPQPVARPVRRDDRDVRPQQTQGREVEVIPVEVRHEDHIDAGQTPAIRDRHDATERPDPRPGRRIGQDPQPIELDDGRGMPDEVDRDRWRRHGTISRRAGRRRRVPRGGAHDRSRAGAPRPRRSPRPTTQRNGATSRHGSSRCPPGSSRTMARAASPPAKTRPSAATTCRADSSGDSAAAVRIAGSPDAGADCSGSIASRPCRSQRRSCLTVAWQMPQSRS